MHRTAQIPSAQKFERIRHIDDYSIARRMHVSPLAGSSLARWRQHLQTCYRLVEEESKRVVVSVPSRPDVVDFRIGFARARVVFHVPQVLQPRRIVRMPRNKEIPIRYFERDGENPQQRQQYRIVDVPREGLDLSQMPLHNIRMREVSVLSRELGDVVALVCVARREGACRARLVAAEIAGGRVAGVFELFVEGEVEDGGGEGVLPPDLGVG